MDTKENKKTKKIVLLVIFAVVFCLSIVGVIVAKNLVMLKQNINLDQLNQSKLNNNQKQNNKYVIIVGASQVSRMKKYYVNEVKPSNTKCDNNKKPEISKKYIKDKNLFFIDQGGSGISHQIGKYTGELGETTVKSRGNDKSAQEKLKLQNNWKLKDRLVQKVREIYENDTNAEVHVFFPLAGNTIKYYTCDGEGDESSLISKYNTKIIGFVDGYYDTILYLKNNISKNKKLYGYVSSMHPDVPYESKEDNKVVNNNNKNACKKHYRSNEKYYRFNLAVKALVNEKDSTGEILRYESLLTQIMKIDDPKSNYSYKVPYCTTDGIHWDQYTTIDWVNRMIKASGRL